MARKAQPTKDDPRVEAAAGAEAETPEAPAEVAKAAAEQQPQPTDAEAAKDEPGEPDEEVPEEEEPPKDKVQPATKATMVEAKLKARWASGGKPHEAGETVQMTRGTYERLKKYGRVE